MKLSKHPGATKKFLTKAWRFHHAFRTPLKDLRPFVEIILAAVPELRGSRLTVDAWVFEPKHLNALLKENSLKQSLQRDSVIEAMNAMESSALLEAALGDWIDFSFVPEPSPFSLYASHDEYVTFFANKRPDLDRVIVPLQQQGFKLLTAK